MTNSKSHSKSLVRALNMAGYFGLNNLSEAELNALFEKVKAEKEAAKGGR